MPRINVRLNGTLGNGGVERWSCGFNFQTDTAPDFQEASALAADIGSALSASAWSALGSLVNGVSAQFSLTDLDVYVYDGTGPAVASGSHTFTTPYTGTGPATAPPQVAAVVTLLTALPGARHRGRFYWPQLAPTISTSLKSSTAKGLASGTVTMLGAIAGQMAEFGNPEPVVFSPTGGTMTPVIAVRAGDVLDTQRRRRDSLQETYTILQYL